MMGCGRREGHLACQVLLCGLCVQTVAAVAVGVEQKPSKVALRLWVAPEGKDDADGSDQSPLASLNGARDRIRALRDKRAAAGPIEVLLRSGTYSLREPLVLESQDSGTPDAPIVYRAADGAKVHQIGGIRIPAEAFHKLTDPAIHKRLPSAARNHVFCADLEPLGVTGLKDWPKAYQALVAPELFFENDRMPLARYPNEGWLQFTREQVVDRGPAPGLEKGSPKAPASPPGGTFEYTDEHPSRWSVRQGVWLYGYWSHDWYAQAIRVAEIDPARKRITLAAPATYGVGPAVSYNKTPRRWFALNLLEELDAPGEWYIDVETRRLYFYPPAALAGKQVVLSLCAQAMIRMHDTRHVCLRGMVIECGQTSAVSMSGEENLVEDCEIRNMGGSGIGVGGRNNGVRACHLHHLGAAGVSLSGGDRKRLIPGGNFVEDCHIHDFSIVNRTYTPAIGFSGCGNRASHNHIHDSPHEAIGYGGNDHVIEYNHIHHVLLDTDDAGALYTGRDWTSFGNMIRYNFIHDLPGSKPVGTWAIYLDDQDSGDTILGNVFYRVSRAIYLSGGRCNRVENNVVIDSSTGLTVTVTGLRKGAAVGDPYEPNSDLMKHLKAVPYDQEPWKSRYPQLANLLQDQPRLPKDNTIRNNLCVGCKVWTSFPRGAEAYLQDPANRNVVADNLVLDQDPGFVDAKGMDFRLRPDSRVWKDLPGFQAIPWERIER